MFLRWYVRGGVGVLLGTGQEKPAGDTNENTGVGQGIAEATTFVWPRQLSFAVHESRTAGFNFHVPPCLLLCSSSTTILHVCADLNATQC